MHTFYMWASLYLYRHTHKQIIWVWPFCFDIEEGHLWRKWQMCQVILILRRYRYGWLKRHSISNKNGPIKREQELIDCSAPLGVCVQRVSVNSLPHNNRLGWQKTDKVKGWYGCGKGLYIDSHLPFLSNHEIKCIIDSPPH